MTLPKKVNWLISILLLTGVHSFAQQYRYQAILDSVKTPGFYHVDLTPALCRFLKDDFSDLRIADKKNNWVPHLITQGTGQLAKSSFYQFTIVSDKLIDSGKTELIAENGYAEKVVNIKLFIRNAAVNRLASVSGSSDGNRWFIISERLLLSRSYEATKEEYLQDLLIPPSNYRYYKLIIDNNQNDPLNITRIGFYTDVKFGTPLQYFQNPAPSIEQKDSAGISYLTLAWQHDCHIERINVSIPDTKFFNRQLTVYSLSVDGTTSGKFLGEFRLASFTNNNFDLPRIKTKKLLLVVNNADNPPLNIRQIQTEQIRMVAQVYFDKPGLYRLFLDNPAAVSPGYDLILFKDSIPAQSIKLNTGSVIPIELIPAEKKEKRWWIWPAIIFAIGVLGFFTYALNRDMKKN